VDDDDDDDDDIDIGIESGEVLEVTDQIVVDNHDLFTIVEIYQAIKSYLTDTGQSLSTLLFNNDMYGTEKNDLCGQFLIKKLMRLDICHPNIAEHDFMD
jgi:hypothetical protein